MGLSREDEALIEEFETALGLDKIVVANNKLVELQKRSAKSGALQEVLDVKLADQVSSCEESFSEIKKLLDDCNSDEGWTLKKKKQRTTVHARYEEGSPQITTKGTTFIPVEKADIPDAFVKLTSLFAETHLMPKWFPNKMMHSNETMEDLTLFRKYLHMKFHPPSLAPVSKRDVVCFGAGYDLTETGELVISYRSIDNDANKHLDFHVPDATSKYTRIEVSGAFYLAIVDGGIIFKSLSMTDLKLNFVPSIVLNFIAINGPFDYVSNVKKNFKNFEGSPWEERVNARPELYEDIRQRVSAFVGITTAKIEEPIDMDAPVELEPPIQRKSSKRNSNKRKSKGKSKKRISNLRSLLPKRKSSRAEEEAPKEVLARKEPEQKVAPTQSNGLLDATALYVTIFNYLENQFSDVFETINEWAGSVNKILESIIGEQQEAR